MQRESNLLLIRRPVDLARSRVQVDQEGEDPSGRDDPPQVDPTRQHRRATELVSREASERSEGRSAEKYRVLVKLRAPSSDWSLSPSQFNY